MAIRDFDQELTDEVGPAWKSMRNSIASGASHRKVRGKARSTLTISRYAKKLL